MPRFDLTGPDGKQYWTEGPEGSTREDAVKMAPQLLQEGKLHPVEEAPKKSLASEVPEQFGIGLVKGVTGLAGLPGDVAAVSPFGGVRGAPTSKDIFSGVESVLGPAPKSTSLAGDLSRTAGEFFPMLFGGEAAMMPRVARWLFPAALSEGAGQVTKGSSVEPWARMAGAMTPATLSMMWRTAPDRMLSAVGDLYASADKNYKHADVRALRIDPAAVQTQAMQIADDLMQRGFDISTSPGTAAALRRMLFEPSTDPLLGGAKKAPVTKTEISMDDIGAVRNLLSDVAGNYNPIYAQDQKWATEALIKIDDWLWNLKPHDVKAGDIAKAIPRLAEARGDYWAAKSLDAIGDKLYAGEMRAGSTYSGQNLDNVIRQNVRGILLNPKARARYTAPEIEQMEKIVQGTVPENIARRISKMLPRSGPIGTLLTGGSVGMFGHLGFLPAAGGEIAAAVETRLGNKLVRDLQDMIVKRSPLGSKGYKPPPPGQRASSLALPAAVGFPKTQDEDISAYLPK